MPLSGSCALKSGNMAIQIDPVAAESEIGLVADLAHEIWNEHYLNIIGQAQIDYMLDKFQSKEAISLQIREEGYAYFLVSTENQPIGYLSIIEKQNELFLSKIYLRKSGRGKGFARIATEFLVARCREKGLSAITLTVNKYNSDSIGAYEKLGFVRYGEVVNDIGAGYVMDDYMMRLPVKLFE